MERISRDTIALFNELKKELIHLDLEENEELEFTYCQIGQLLTDAFSVSLTKLNGNFLTFKFWNTKFYRKGFENGWFNLDRLAITKEKIEITDFEYTRIQNLINKDLSKINIDGFVLDGLFCQLKLEDKTLEWNLDREMNKNLNNLISLLREKVNVQHRL